MINIAKVLNAATMGNSKRVRPMIFWVIAEYFFKGAPYGVSLGLVWVLFLPLTEGTALNINHIVWLCIALLISLILHFLIGKQAYAKTNIEGYKICAEGRLALTTHMKKLPMGFFNANDPGTIGEYIVGDYANAEFLLTHLIPQIIGAVVMPIVLLISLSFFSWKMALLALLVIPLAYPFSLFSSFIIGYAGRKQQLAKRTASSRMLEYIQGIKLIKSFNLQGSSFVRMQKAFEQLKTTSLKLEAGAGPSIILTTIVLNFGITLIILFGLTFLLAGEISMPIYIMFLILGCRVYEPLMQVFAFMAEITYMNLSVERITQLRQTPLLSEGRLNSIAEDCSIEFNQVDFAYNDIRILRNFTASFPAKSLTALVGPSGSGKTTVTRLIARFWDPQKGEIKVAGHDIKDYQNETLIGAISIVFQDVYLFNDTVYNNIRIGKPDATKEEIEAVAKLAHCHDFIERMPNKYQSLVGEGGSKLSGGEKQRISIARAILKDAPIIILDEATAALDPENEYYIQQAINALVKDKTVIVIAHRLNTIKRANKIVVVDNGTVVQQGNHDELIAVNGLYQHLWHEQDKAKQWKF